MKCRRFILCKTVTQLNDSSVISYKKLYELLFYLIILIKEIIHCKVAKEVHTHTCMHIQKNILNMNSLKMEDKLFQRKEKNFHNYIS